VVERFGSLGIDLVSPGDLGLETTNPHGKLIFSIRGSVAEFEPELIRERTRAGMTAAQNDGESGSVVLECTSPKEQARSLVAQDMSQPAVARRLGGSHATLQTVPKRVPADGVVRS
jgi:DNA invertase Pin-like site-specific DNA recombinase